MDQFGLLALASFFTIISSHGVGAEEKPFRRIAVTQIVEHPALDSTRAGILDELKANGLDPKTNLEWTFDSAQGNPVLATQIAQKCVNKNPDVIVAIGTLSAQSAVAATRRKEIPIIFSSITDPVNAKLVRSLDRPAGNATGVSNRVSTEKQFTLFKKIVPELTHLGIIYNPGEANSAALNTIMKEVASKVGLQLVFAAASKTVEVSTATESLLNRVQAIFVNNDNTALSAFKNIVKLAERRKVAVFASDTDMIDQGAIASLGPNQYEIGRQTARMILKVFSGIKPTQLPVEFPLGVELHLNLKAARRIGRIIPVEVINDAQKTIEE